jgi:MarR family transcriptional regulator for hemolysin
MATATPEDHLAFLIHLAAKRMRLEFASRAAGYGLTPSKARALAFLARRPGANLTALAEALEVQPMSVLRVVDDLEAQGMLRRDPDPDDRRALRLSLTAAGEAANARIWRTLDGIVGDATQGMTDESIARLIEGLRSLVDGMDRFVADAPAEPTKASEARRERVR